MPNRLARETSPYLLQHAENPVDWYPWGEEALERAKVEDKPILLSIGYSACHWCHVMAHESFENDQIARIMNSAFVCIKVDREERPDIDGIYMAAVQTLTGSGGWPLTVFLTPDGKPFFGGTYFPPDERGHMPGFPRVLNSMADAYRNKKGDVLQATSEITGRLAQMSSPSRSDEPLNRELCLTAFNTLARGFDWENGGFGQAPKFPQPLVMDVVLRQWSHTDASLILEMVQTTLDKMAQGGIYDHIGGGFARYSTDEQWLVPHFEKMLYDNALLVSLYSHAFQATGKPLYRRVVEETLSFVEREMSHAAGGFYSSFDADSEGVEGKFYVWSVEQIDDALGEHDGRIVRAYYGVDATGNFEGSNILWIPRALSDVAEELQISGDDILSVIERSRPKLYEERLKRIPPGLDDKILVSWNAMMMTAFAEAGMTFNKPEWVERATANASFLLANLFDGDRLLRTWKANADSKETGSSKIPGYLEDYASLAAALITLYEATADQDWLNTAQTLTDQMIALFQDESSGVFYDTGSDASELFTRPRDVFDNAIPCGGSSAAHVLLRLSTHTGQQSYRTTAEPSIASVREYMEKSGAGVGGWLSALDYYVDTPKEIVVIGDRDEPATQALINEVNRLYLPNRVIAGANAPTDPAPSPLLENRTLINHSPTAYVCENYACQLPVTTPADLNAQLKK